ncbi:capsule biosynthesis phosphatase [Colletotrichum paranaense]|uniref:Mannose-1-phosphate guanyltransferase n=6 Tax=Colletotrichum acutatum species complex TaxID=2707335 RepID=A0A9P9X2L1_9PEZI|nr:capsule biosynthesis phosphatase [Colletotrichum lupini]XP_060313630.1 capsule biosynthesis phosphatase [Colletotrichum costaricense]XP_060350571.1 capsule biosynthesis phosphatase [Colletotrichum paranaense]XP_060377886.1 capsule biosynthesis phosphatase [Colletotrichum tamarilloi]XP_060405596.1 capsule biosynthesis phosphatase [Colletotrichum abscissum]KAI3531465.1 capsule biosynthesis phosphatase [Colletotrichum filicis]KAK1451405.1 capsule biosynthesis phosphatase [Colletotrichum melon
MAPQIKAAANGAAANGDVNHEPINVIIPIGGIGSRFAKEGYRYPKPLINIVGRPMLLWLIDNLSLKPGDTLWMAINEEVDDEFRIGQLVSKTFSKIDFRLLRLRHQTKGASETLYIVTQSMTKKHLERKTVSLDCDTIYWADVLQDIRNMPKGHGGCFYFPDVGDKPIFSYIKTEPKDGLERIVDIQEKKAISNKANTGAYVFPSAGQLKSWAAQNLDMKRPDGSEVGEYYTSQMIALMIQNGVPYLGMPVSTKDFSVVGTPEQLKDLLKLLKTDTSNLPIKLKKRRFCFDLDMTLVGVPAVAGDYSTCPPIEKNIRLVQQLYNAGHYIIIQTARRMRTHHGNLGSVLADVGPVTFAQLAKYEIPYHDIHFGKPYADVYVDDLAVNANLDTMREIGWLLDEQDPAALIGQDAATGDDAKKAGMIAARDFNTIQIIGDKVIKSSKSENILGELFFYSHMPAEIAQVFPTVYNVDYIPDTTTYNITMENRRGLTFSHLLVGRSITKGRLISLLKALHTVHTTGSTDKATLNIPSALEKKFEEHSLARANNRVNIYANYGSKLRSRYYKDQHKYDALGPLAASLFARINEFLDTYEAEEKGVHAQVIHGDPVFSNAILSKDEKLVSFIDVRCQLENTLTPEGDIHYDLGKVLQSLCGYDHILFMSANNYDLRDALDSDKPLLDEADSDLLESLQEHFFTFLEETYSVRLHRKTLFRITASLFFSLIPLHRPELGAVFLRMCKETLDKASNINYGPGARSTSGLTLSRRASSNFGSDEKAREMPIASGKGENLSIPSVTVTAK